MRGKERIRYFVGDFETTVYEGQEDTEVWASAVVELGSEDVDLHHSIGETFDLLQSMADDSKIIIWYHNLKFDGAFWLAYLVDVLGFKQAAEMGDDEHVSRFMKDKDMPMNSFKYVISDMGQWYTITIKCATHIIEIRDSLKLLPFSVKKIGKSFGTKHKKLDMEYTGYRYAGCVITDEEAHYIKNDVLVVKEALEIMMAEGHNKLTIGSCCLSEYIHIISNIEYRELFPNVFKMELDESEWGSPNIGEYIRKSYKGGWCYVVKGKEKQIKRNGITADVNSLYPSVMSSESGSIYPRGMPMTWRGNYIPEHLIKWSHNRYYFVRIRCRFKLKKNYLPFIQIKGSFYYRGNECLETSDYYDKKTKSYHRYRKDILGRIHDSIVELTLTCTDYKLFLEHYDVYDLEILDGVWFYAQSGLFDEYIDKYRKLKMESTGARRELAKLFLNNLYGKMASSTNSSFKVAYKKDDGSIGYYTELANDKKPGYIPIGSAITSYARNFTIRAAQMNYYGKNKPGFIYADTDSIHCDLSADELKGITVDDKKFCCWKLEASWDIAWFTRQKTYIEHVVAENLEAIEKPYYNVKCAGMPQKCKHLFVRSLEGYEESDGDDEKYTEQEIAFMKQKRELTDFDYGLIVPGKLLPKRIKGGIVLVDVPYEMSDII